MRPTPLEGFDYDQLKRIVEDFEVNGMGQDKSPIRSFNKTMQLEDRGGLGVEWAWVRKCNVEYFAGDAFLL